MNHKTSTILPVSTCLKCSQPLSAAFDPSGFGKPRLGDYAICVFCGEVAIFNHDLQLRPPEPEEISAMIHDTEIIEIALRLPVFADWLRRNGSRA